MSTGASLTLGNNVDLTLGTGSSLTLGTGSTITVNPGSTLNIGDNATVSLASQPLVFKSNAFATGALGPISNTATLTGADNVVVERYISPGRKWRFLSAPLDGQSFKQAWQEGATTAGGNPNSGYGFLIGGVGSTATTNGFDFQSAAPMVKTYDAATNNWVGISATTNLMNSQSGYMCFVAGDRLGISSTTPTTTRMTGTLKYGDRPVIPVPQNTFVAVGNPYPSAVKLTSISVSNLRSVFYVWDPNLAGGSYGLGAYQTFSLNAGTGNYEVTPGGGSYGVNGSVVTNLESGQAFFIQGNTTGGAGSIQFKETHKGLGSAQVFFTAEAPQRVRINLGAMQTDSSVLISDGVMVRYGDNYNNAVTDEDILKLGNTNENVGLLSGGQTLAVENRNGVQNNDTLHLKLSGVRVQSYQWSLVLDNMDAPGRMAFLLDRYKQTSTPLNMAGTTKFNFTIENILGSYASDRFKIVFTQQSVLPVTITSVNAIRNSDKTVGVLWKTANETNLNHYEVERSVNGVSFTSIGSVLPKANNGASAQYLFTDKDLIGGDLFYRIKAISEGGRVQYSSIVKIGASKGTGSMLVSPNPVENKQMTIRYDGVETGSYVLALLNGAGQKVCSTKITISGATGTQTIPMGKLVSSGNYLLLITSPDGSMRSEQVMVK
jgi:hypothetical protein